MSHRIFKPNFLLKKAFLYDAALIIRDLDFTVTTNHRNLDQAQIRSFNLGAWGVLYTYTPEQYPTNIRAFGSGWASAIGRMGGIVAPMVVTHMMVMQNGFSYVFMMFTAVLLAVAVVIVVLGEETKGRTLESIGL